MMTTHTLTMLTLEFSGILLAVLVLRPLLRRAFGAACAYAGWLLVPLLMAVAQMPASRPGLALHRLVRAEVPAAPIVALPVEVEPTPTLLLAWGAGVIVVLALLVVQQLRYRRTLSWNASEKHWRGPIGNGPGLMGLFPPRLVLPADFESRFTPAQQQLILAHEAVHQARGDNFWNLLAVLCCAVQWFNPLAWFSLRALRIDQELACDAAVLSRSPEQHSDYAHALLHAQGVSMQGLPWASWRSSHPLVERIEMLKIHAGARRRVGLLAVLALGLLTAGAVHALQSKQPTALEHADVKLDLSLAYSETVDGKSSSWETTTVVAVKKDETFHVRLPIQRSNGKDDELELIVSAAPRGEGFWKISTELRQGQPAKTLTKPFLITADGKKATIEQGESAPEGHAQHLIRIGVTPTAVKPQP